MERCVGLTVVWVHMCRVTSVTVLDAYLSVNRSCTVVGVPNRGRIFQKFWRFIPTGELPRCAFVFVDMEGHSIDVEWRVISPITLTVIRVVYVEIRWFLSWGSPISSRSCPIARSQKKKLKIRKDFAKIFLTCFSSLCADANVFSVGSCLVSVVSEWHNCVEFASVLMSTKTIVAAAQVRRESVLWHVVGEVEHLVSVCVAMPTYAIAETFWCVCVGDNFLMEYCRTGLWLISVVA